MQLGFRGYGLGIWVTCGSDKLEEKEKKRRERLGQRRRKKKRCRKGAEVGSLEGDQGNF